MMDAMRAGFRDEAYELLAQLESALLELEAAPADVDAIGRVFRLMHTIKGSGAMFGFDRVSRFTHEIETVYDLVREGKSHVTPELITLTLTSRDHIKALLEADFGGAEVTTCSEEDLLRQFRLHSSSAPRPADEARVVEPEPETGHREEKSYQILFKPGPHLLQRGTNPLLLLDELKNMGPCRLQLETSRLPELSTLDPELCYLGWRLSLETSAGIDAIRDVFIFVEDDSIIEIQASPVSPPPSLQEPSNAPSAATDPVAEQNMVTAGSERLGGTTASDEPGQSAVVASNEERRVKPADNAASLRVTAEKLDSLVNSVGELVTAQARLSRIANASEDPELGFVAEEMERLIERLRSDTMSMRMLPIGHSFARFRRLVRDLSQELDKQVELVTDGAETELDKTVIERLNDPLVHLIRNCVDHGIETPAVRTAAQKPAHGTVRLSASHSGAHVLIRIQDDGAGLNREAILRKATERGLIAEGVEIPDHELYRLIFAPGFSTAKQVTSISGRGVGLDVVERSIRALRGSVEVKSKPGEGTTFTLKLPLTLAIIDGILVSVGDQRFILPVSNVVECVEIARSELQKVQSRRTVVVRDEMVPYISLREYFTLGGEAPDVSQVMLAETEYGKFGFVVDEVLGDHQTVIKSLGRLYRDIEAISGANILGDGNVALILDPDKLMRGVLSDAAPRC